ncbi:hypothetical protein C343_00864 [Cryptococcus neoformans C23]|nr:hypothetical protein C347_00937 [Cryptococcus neoformans var. grubii AD2-60a]OWZ47737.1 hypothetical protein C343_00864 [Cryptococcus neoformans var. grubii C23]OXC86829.1 hypothetical protein C344_00871 [Cryptococcus neoformans var. grubii AD1-7a]OXH38818.1 hypothetical protein J005_00869 [Cryptococcus neoformans var. grubii]
MKRGLCPLFTESALSDVLVGVYDNLILRDVTALMLVNRHSYQVFKSSIKLQLEHRRKLYSVPATTPFLDFFCRKTATDKFKALEEREYRFNNFKPAGIETICKSSRLVSLQAGHMLFEYHNDKRNPGRERKTSGWEVYRTRTSATDDDCRCRGGVKDQGLWKWRMDLGKGYYDIVMCAEENVVMICQKRNYHPNHNPSTWSVSIRMYFYVLVPPSGTSPPSLGYFDPIPHPDAALPFIEIIVPNVSEETTATFDMAAGGQVSLLFVDDDLDTEEVYVGVWDWKNGVCLGSLVPDMDPTVEITSYAHMGPFVVTSCTRHVPASSNPIAFINACEEADVDKSPATAEDHFVELCFYVHALLPPQYGYPPHTPSTSHRDPKKPFYPTMPCTWTLDDIPFCFPITIFDLPPAGLMPWTVSRYYQSDMFYINECYYDEEVHNREIAGLLTWTIAGRISVADMRTITSAPTAIALRRAMWCLQAGYIPPGKVVVDPNIIASLTPAEHARWSIEVLMLAVYGHMLDKKGRWTINGGISTGRPMARNPILQRIPTPRTTPRIAHTDWMITDSHYRFTFVPTMSSIHGAREFRMAAILIDRGLVLDNGMKIATAVLSLNDYNRRTGEVQWGEDVDGKAEEGKNQREREEMDDRSEEEAHEGPESDTVIDHTFVDQSKTVPFRIHQHSPYCLINGFMKDSRANDLTQWPHKGIHGVLHMAVDMTRHSQILFDGDTIVFGGFTVSCTLLHFLST